MAYRPDVLCLTSGLFLFIFHFSIFSFNFLANIFLFLKLINILLSRVSKTSVFLSFSKYAFICSLSYFLLRILYIYSYTISVFLIFCKIRCNSSFFFSELIINSLYRFCINSDFELFSISFLYLFISLFNSSISLYTTHSSVKAYWKSNSNLFIIV